MRKAKSPRKSSKPPEAPAAIAAVPTPLHELSLKAWRSHPDLQARLRRLIEDPTFLLATQSILRAAYPGFEPATKAEPGVTAEAANNALSQRYAHRSGVGFFPKMLKYLVTTADVAVPMSGHGLLPEDE